MKPFSSAAEYRNGLKPDPGWRCACVARLNLPDLASKLSKPPTSARMAPSSGLSATSAEAASGICASRALSDGGVASVAPSLPVALVAVSVT